MQKLAIALTLLTGATIHLLAQGESRVVYLAQHGHGRVGQRTFGTQTFVINKSESIGVTVTLESFDESGERAMLFGFGPDALHTIQRGISADAVGTFFSRNGTSEDIGVGWVRVTYPAVADLEVQSIFRIQTPDALETKAGILGATPQTSVTFFAEQLAPGSQPAESTPSGPGTEGVRTGVALLLPPEAEAEAEVTIQVFDQEGEDLGEAPILILQPGQKMARFLDELVDNLPDFIGKVRVISNRPVVVTPLLQAGFILTSREVFTDSEIGME